MTKEEADSLLARLAVLETLTGATLAYTALQMDDPVRFVATVMDNVETSLVRGREAAPASHRHVADISIQHFQRYSASMLAMVNRISDTKGNG